MDREFDYFLSEHFGAEAMSDLNAIARKVELRSHVQAMIGGIIRCQTTTTLIIENHTDYVYEGPIQIYESTDHCKTPNPSQKASCCTQ